MTEQVIPYKNFDNRLMLGDQGAVIQSFIESNIKRGLQFYTERYFDIPANSAVYWRFYTGDTKVILKNRVITATNKIVYTASENATINPANGSTPLTIFNYNKEKQEELISDVVITPNVTIQNGNEGNIFTIHETPSTTNQSAASFDPLAISGYERILPKQTEYLLKFVNGNNASVRVYFYVDFYQGVLSNESR